MEDELFMTMSVLTDKREQNQAMAMPICKPVLGNRA